ncbi:MXAN_5187 family protein [Cystobacter fuscus]|uniref:MXAN_5187 family protein n=1 Tax=Cystobacter fuscus TaxID=43 RepID=UPI002B2A1FD3|nr:cell division protein FtsK [Cystobacter fuscus]
MVRFKFFVFALLVLGLGVAHLPLVSSPLSAEAVKGAASPATAAISELARALEARRSSVQALALSLAGNPEVVAAVQPQVEALPRGKGIRIVEPPVGERFNALRAAVGERVPKPLEDSLVLGLVTAEGALYAHGTGEASADEQFDPRSQQKVGSEGAVADAFGAPHVFFSVPVLWSPDGGHAQVAATLVLGAPVLHRAFLESAAVNSGVAALALVQGNQVLESAGAEKELVTKALENVGAGKSGQVVERGSVRNLLAQVPRVRLPLLTHPSDTLGGDAPLAVGSRQSLGGDLEAVAVTSVRPFMTALANYQHDALFALLGLLGFSLVWTLLMGADRPSAATAAPKKQKKGGKQQEEPASAPAAGPALASSPLAGPVFLTPAPEPPTAGPEDFPFSDSPAPARPAAATSAPETPFDAPSDTNPFAAPPEPAVTRAPAPAGDLYPFATPEVPRGGDPFGTPTVPGKDPFGTPTVPGKDPFASQGGASLPFSSTDSAASVPAAAPRRGAAFAFEDHPTAAYSLQQAADPFAAATAQARQNGGFDEEGGSPEPTRVAAIPRELLARSARPMTGEVNVPPSALGLHPGVASPMNAPQQQAGVTTSPFGTGAGAATSASTGAGAVALSEEQHFQEVFREFVQTRDQCGEPQDGLTYDKFVAKLRKNREQLVQKYACKTVRFQVYVKEGKAALKATPVKD